MNKYKRSLTLAFGSAASITGLMAVGAPSEIVMSLCPAAVAIITAFGGLVTIKDREYSGMTYMAGTVGFMMLGMAALDALSPGALEQYLPSHEETIPLSEYQQTFDLES